MTEDLAERTCRRGHVGAYRVNAQGAAFCQSCKDEDAFARRLADGGKTIRVRHVRQPSPETVPDTLAIARRLARVEAKLDRILTLASGVSHKRLVDGGEHPAP